MTDDFDQPPASDDTDIQGFLDTQWREAMRAARDGMETLRLVNPELMEHLPETAQRSIMSATSQITGAYRDLHAAGKHVIGQDAYDEYVRAQTSRAIGR